MDQDLSSCSFFTDAVENMSSEVIRDGRVQQLELEIERLKQVNNDLRNGMDVLKNQLKEIVETTSSSQNVTDNVQQLKLQLQEKQNKLEKATLELNELKSKNDSNNNKMVIDRQQLENIKNELEKTIASKTEVIGKLKKEISQLKSQVSEKDQLLDLMTQNIKKNKNDKKSRKRAINELKNENMHLREEVARVVKMYDIDKQQLLSDLDYARGEVSSLSKTKDEMAIQIDKQKKLISNMNNSHTLLLEQLSSQVSEISAVAKDRERVVKLTSTLQRALSISEDRIHDLLLQKQLLNEKVMSLTKQSSLMGTTISTNLLYELTLPFDGDFKYELENIMKLPQYQPLQKVQLLINKCANRIEEVEKELNSSLDKNGAIFSEINETRAKCDHYCQLLDSLLLSLKEIVYNEESMERVDIRKDKRLVDLIADKVSQIDPQLRETITKDPRFISHDFFTTTDLIKRKKQIEELLNPPDCTYAIFVSQFLLNSMLRAQLNQVINKLQLQTQREVERDVPRQNVQVTQPDSPYKSEEFSGLKDKIEKVTASRNKLYNQFNHARNEITNLNRENSDQKVRISQLELKNEELRNELNVVKVKLHCANNELSMSRDNTFVSQIKEMDENSKAEVNQQLKDELVKKTNECAELRAELTSLQTISNKEYQNKEKQLKKIKELYNSEVYSLKQLLEETELKYKSKTKNLKKKERDIQFEYENQIRSLNCKLEDIKTSASNSIRELQERESLAKENARKLQDQVFALEQKLQDCSEENNTLQASQKASQLEIGTLKQQISKDQQKVQGQLSAQMMAYETKIQQLQQDFKVNSQKQLKELCSFIYENIGMLYGIDENDMLEDTVKQLIVLVKSDLEKLKYFQDQDTMYHHSR